LRGALVAIGATSFKILPQLIWRCFSTDSHHPLAWPIKEGNKAYGEPNFGLLRKIGTFHSDRSRYIRQLVTPLGGVVFLRPPSFGKTSFLSMLEHYHDVRFKDRFDELFEGMDIHRDDTRDAMWQGYYHVLSIKLPVGLGENTYTTFGDCINDSVTSFLDGHPDVLQASDYDKAVDFINERMRLGGTLMMLVDEYDRAGVRRGFARRGEV
jgi:hypothetical protein